MQLYITPINAKLFSVDTLAKKLFADHSDLTVPYFGQPNLFAPLYDDACDVGIAIHNPDTGVTTRWYQSETHRREGDVTMWTFKPTSESLRSNPRLDGWTVVIFND